MDVPPVLTECITQKVQAQNCSAEWNRDGCLWLLVDSGRVSTSFHHNWWSTSI